VKFVEAKTFLQAKLRNYFATIVRDYFMSDVIGSSPLSKTTTTTTSELSAFGSKLKSRSSLLLGPSDDNKENSVNINIEGGNSSDDDDSDDGDSDIEDALALTDDKSIFAVRLKDDEEDKVKMSRALKHGM
jgi:hypothetical protein